MFIRLFGKRGEHHRIPDDDYDCEPDRTETQNHETGLWGWLRGPDYRLAWTILLLIWTIFQAWRTWGLLFGTHNKQDLWDNDSLDTRCIKHTSKYCKSKSSRCPQPALADPTSAPFDNEVGVKYSEVQFNGSFLHTTAFRRDAGSEVDAAWESLGVNCKNILFSSPPLPTRIIITWRRSPGTDTGRTSEKVLS